MRAVNLSDYINIILSGYSTRPEYLDDYFLSECIKSQKEGIGIPEFFNSLLKANEIFIDEIKSKKYARLNEIELARADLIAEGKPTDILIGQENMNFSVNLFHLTNGKFRGFLWSSDLNIIREAIVTAIGKVSNEIDSLLKQQAIANDSNIVEGLETLSQKVTELWKVEYDLNTEKSNQSFLAFTKQHNELRNKFRVNTTLTREEAVRFNDPKITEGMVMERNPPIPNNPGAAFNLFKNYYATVQFEFQKHEFETSYKVWNQPAIDADLKMIEAWINAAEKLNYKEAVEGSKGNSRVILNHDKADYEYLRLKNGFYEGHLMTDEQHNENSLSAVIYGRYFLFRDYLKEKMTIINNPASTNVNAVVETITTDKNNFLNSTIEDWLYKFREKMSDENYEILVSSLMEYFTTGIFPTLTNKIKVTGRVNKKLLGWALNQIYKVFGKGNLSKEYLLFAKQNISIFNEVAFDENDILGSNLYKYFTTKTQ